MDRSNIKTLLFSFCTFIGALLIFNTLGIYTRFSFLYPIISLIFALLIYQTIKKRRTKESSNLPPVSTSKQKFYLTQGLTIDEMNFFRETMNEARLQIIELEETINHSSRLKSINHRYQTVETSKNFFQSIVNQPMKLSKVNDFLYRDLPDLVTLSKKFLDIEAHPNKNKATLQVIDKSIDKIEHLCQSIESEYLNFQKEEIENWQPEVNDSDINNGKDESHE